jgi:rubrerythrin
MFDLQSTLAVLRRAIRDEVAGQRFYGEASFYCVDPRAKEIFADLSQEEEAHTQLLLMEYEALTTEGRWIDPQIAMASGSEVDITRFTFLDDEPSEELFPPEWPIEEAVDRWADDLSALALGIQMEERAINLYKQSSREIRDPAAEEAYGFLVEEEMRHYHTLVKQRERLSGVALER